MDTNKSMIIHKRNELTRGADNYSIHAKRLMNIIYYLVQYNLSRENDVLKAETITIEFSHLRKLMGLEKVENYIAIIENALKELKQPFELFNFYHPLEKELYQWYTDSFLARAGWIKKGKKRYARIQISDLIKHIMRQKGNFTELDLLLYQNRVRTKYAIKLYEFLKSFKDYNTVRITHDHILKLFGLEESKKYKYFSQIRTLLERQVQEIKKKTDLNKLEMEAIKKEKVFRFVLTPSSTEISPKTQEIEDIIDKILNKKPYE